VTLTEFGSEHLGSARYSPAVSCSTSMLCSCTR